MCDYNAVQTMRNNPKITFIKLGAERKSWDFQHIPQHKLVALKKLNIYIRI